MTGRKETRHSRGFTDTYAMCFLLSLIYPPNQLDLAETHTDTWEHGSQLVTVLCVMQHETAQMEAVKTFFNASDVTYQSVNKAVKRSTPADQRAGSSVPRCCRGAS